MPEFLYTYKTQYKVEQEHKVKQSKATKIPEPNWLSKREVDKEMNKQEWGSYSQFQHRPLKSQLINNLSPYINAYLSTPLSIIHEVIKAIIIVILYWLVPPHHAYQGKELIKSICPC